MRTAAEAGRVHRADPAIIEIDTARMVATGETIWHAGVTVYLTENVSGDYLSIVDPADPELSLLRETWLEEE
jgi:RNA:NAD 2'-phosphotransferase (TPT1/KptA family)